MSSTLVSTITSFVSTPVTIGAGIYAYNLTIAQGGGIFTGAAGALSVDPGLTGVTINNEPGALIVSNGSKYSVSFASSARLNNLGVISDRGVDVAAGGYVYNGGNIYGLATSGAGENGVVLTNANIFNRGTIKGGNDGILATSYANISNHNDIYGSVAGIELENGGHVGNAISISGGTYGVLLDNGGFVGTANHLSGGTDAILNRAGKLTVNLYPAQGGFGGAVVDEAGNGVFDLMSGRAGHFNMGGTVTGFSNLNFQAGSNWVLEGPSSELANGATITGFTAGETIQLDSFGAVGDTYVAGIGLELTNGAATETLDIKGSLITANFVVSNLQTATSISFIAGTVLPPGNGTLAAGHTLNTPIIEVGSSEFAANGSTIYNPVIDGGTLELAPSATVIGNINFEGDSGVLILDGTLGSNNTIIGFAPGDSVVLNGVPYDPATDSVSVSSPGVLHIDADGANYFLDLAGAYYGEPGFTLSPGLTLSELPNAVCFARGTHIATPEGEIRVENLAIGDLVFTAAGKARFINWIGHRAYAPEFVRAHRAIWPVRIAAGALADGLPARDLSVSPCHALFFDGALIPAGCLVNGANIAQLEPRDKLEYFHIELDAHDIILAEGVPAESYLDEHNRGVFHNAAGYVPPETPPTACAPRMETGAAVETIRARINQRAGLAQAELGVHLTATGITRVILPAGSSLLRLHSGQGFAAGDSRPLGAFITRITVDGKAVDLADPALLRGFHAREPGGRWTNGDALLALPPSTQPRIIRIATASLMQKAA